MIRHITVSAVAVLLAAVGSAHAQYSQANANVVISQVSGGGSNSGAQYNRDFIELHNRTAAPVDMTGWSIQFASAAAGTFTRYNLPSGATVPAYGYYLIECVPNPLGTNGVAIPTPDTTATGFASIGAAGSRVALVRNTTTLVAPGDFTGTAPSATTAVEDFMGFGTNSSNVPASQWEGSGRAGTGSNTTAARRKNKGCQDTGDSSADFFLGAPVPRNTASPIWNCSTQTATASDLGINVVANPSTCAQTSAPGPVTFTYTVTNNGPDAASNVVVTFTVSEPSTAGTFTPDVGAGSVSGSRPTVTWTIGSMANGQTKVLTYTNTLNTPGTMSVRGVVGSNDVEDGTGGNDSVTAAVSLPDVAGAPKAMIASGSENGLNLASSFAPIPGQPAGAAQYTGTQFGLGRPYASPNGERWVMVTETTFVNTPDASSLLVVGQGDAISACAQEGITVFGSAVDNASIKTGAFSSSPFDRIAAIDNSGNVLVTFLDNTVAVAPPNNPAPKRVLARGTPPVNPADNTVPYSNWTIIAREGNAVPLQVLTAIQGVAPLTASATWGSTMRVAGLNPNGTASFYATVVTAPSAGNAINEVLVSWDGNVLNAATVVALESAFEPTNQPTDEHYLIQSAGTGTVEALDQATDANFASRGYIMNGIHWKAEGSIGRNAGTVLDAARDQVLVVDGRIVLREGQLLGGFSGADTVAAAANPALTNHSWVRDDGLWYAYGVNASVGGARPNGWVVRGTVAGTPEVLAKTGDNIRTGSTEKWSNQVSAQTFNMMVSRGTDYVIGGLTDNPDNTRDVVLVYKNNLEVLREGDPINIGTQATPQIVYCHTFIESNRAFIDDDHNLYVVCATRNASWVCTGTGLTGQVLVKIALPGITACNKADVAGLGGSIGPDGFLTVDDIVVYLAQFFAANLAVADIASLGGNLVPDGVITVDDLVAFLSQFFSPCNP